MAKGMASGEFVSGSFVEGQGSRTLIIGRDVIWMRAQEDEFEYVRMFQESQG